MASLSVVITMESQHTISYPDVPSFAPDNANPPHNIPDAVEVVSTYFLTYLRAITSRQNYRLYCTERSQTSLVLLPVPGLVYKINVILIDTASTSASAPVGRDTSGRAMP